MLGRGRGATASLSHAHQARDTFPKAYHQLCFRSGCTPVGPSLTSTRHATPHQQDPQQRPTAREILDRLRLAKRRWEMHETLNTGNFLSPTRLSVSDVARQSVALGLVSFELPFSVCAFSHGINTCSFCSQLERSPEPYADARMAPPQPRRRLPSSTMHRMSSLSMIDDEPLGSSPSSRATTFDTPSDASIFRHSRSKSEGGLVDEETMRLLGFNTVAEEPSEPHTPNRSDDLGEAYI